jgi:thioredoxin reductase
MYEIAIIGGGPAGGSAAIFAAKAGKKTIVLDNGKSVTKRALLNNHYGAPEIGGPDLMETGQKQARDHGAEIVHEEVTEAEKTDNGFLLKTESDQYEAKHVILASGYGIDIGEKLGVNVKEGTEPRVTKIFEVNEKGQTNVSGVWACGLAAGVSVHTIITAGDGARVAINLLSEINGERYVDHDILK